jgi:D-alanyl-D-alanine carboxypeptidase
VTFFYNNGDYIVLGKIIEAVERVPFDAVLSRRVLGPLAMTNTGMHYQHRVVPKLADTYFTRDDRDNSLANDLPVYTENWYAAGAMYATAGDLLRFAGALFGDRLLEPASRARLMTPGLDGYGYGAWIYQDVVAGRKLTSLMRPGQIMGVNTVLYHVVEPGVTVIVLGNTDKANVDALAHQLSKQLAQ